MKYLVTNPLNYLFAFLVLSLCLHLFVRLKKRWYVGMLCVGVLLVFAITPRGANMAISMIDVSDSHPNCESDNAVMFTEIPTRRVMGLSDFGSLSSETIDRAQVAVDWLSKGINRNLYILGLKNSNREISEAEVTANFAQKISTIPKNIVAISASGKTLLDRTSQLSQSITNKKLVLIISDIRSRRQSYALDQYGFSTCILISDRNTISAHPIRMLIPSPESISKLEEVLWEAFGLLSYKLGVSE